MKSSIIFSLLILFLSISSCKNSSQQKKENVSLEIIENKIIGKKVTIGRLEISEHDFPNKMTWSDAKIACASLGEGWRLPNTQELNVLYQNKSVVGEFRDDFYWSADIGIRVGNILFAFKTNLFNGESTTRDAWIDGEETYENEGKIIFASPEDTSIQPAKNSLKNLSKEVLERKGTYRDLNFVRAVKSN
jgi:hypothetical protein